MRVSFSPLLSLPTDGTTGRLSRRRLGQFHLIVLTGKLVIYLMNNTNFFFRFITVLFTKGCALYLLVHKKQLYYLFSNEFRDLRLKFLRVVQLP